MPKFHHLDRRVDQIAAIGAGSDDDLLTTDEVASWFGVSRVWLEIGRSKNYGPKFTKLAAKIIRYKRGDCRKFIKARTFSNTTEYKAARRKERARATA